MLVQLSLHFDRSPADISIAEVKEYLYYSRQERYLSNSFINQTISAVKILKQDILGEKWEGVLEIKRPRRSCHLPRILSVEEVKLMLEVTKNLKYKSILSVLYSSGIRLSELLGLHLGDIDSKQMLIRVTDGKGQKSRDTILSVKTQALLRSYYRKIDPKPKVYLFESVEAGEALFGYFSSKNCKKSSYKSWYQKKHISPQFTSCLCHPHVRAGDEYQNDPKIIVP